MWKFNLQSMQVESDEHKFYVEFWSDSGGLPWFSIDEVKETSWRPFFFGKPVAITHRFPVRTGWTEDNRVELVAGIIRRYLDEDRRAREEGEQIKRLCQMACCKLEELGSERGVT